MFHSTNLHRFIFTLGTFLVANSAWALEPAEQTMRASVRVFSGTASGSGFLVAPDDSSSKPNRVLLVTAAHVFDDLANERCTLVLRTLTPAKTFERKPVETVIRGPQGPLWIRHPEVDVAILPVEIPAEIDLQPYALDQIADTVFVESGKILVGNDAFIPCFPVQFEANPAGFPVLRRGSIASYPLFPIPATKTILIDYSNFKGDSGAPVVVWREGRPVVIGLISGMHRQTERTVTPSEERTVHSSLGLGIAVQAPYLRDTVEIWKKASGVTR
jgi:Trypsin-like peptidase domain